MWPLYVDDAKIPRLDLFKTVEIVVVVVVFCDVVDLQVYCCAIRQSTDVSEVEHWRIIIIGTCFPAHAAEVAVNQRGEVKLEKNSADVVAL